MRAKWGVFLGMRSAHIVLLSGFALVACGDDDPNSVTSSPATATETSVVATTPATPDEVPEPTDTVVTVPAPTDVVVSSSPATVPRSAGASGCSVTVTGAVSAEWTSDAGGFQAFVYGGWLANPSAEDARAFALNCYDSDYNIVGFGASPGTEIPMGPSTYDLTDSFDPDVPINAEVALIFDDGLWEAGSGTFEILEFDDAHIRGRFSLAIRDSFDNTRAAEVTGEFAYSR